MASIITGSITYATGVQIPSPGEGVTAESVGIGFSDLADRTAFIMTSSINNDVIPHISSSDSNFKRWIVETAALNTSESQPSFISSTADILSFVDTHNGYVIAVGGPTGIVASSADGGKSWVSGTLASYYANTLNDVTSGSATNSIVAVGQQGKIISAPFGGGSWTDRSPDGGFSGHFFGVTWASTISAPAYLAVGHNQEIQRSTDGATWTSVFTGGTHTLSDIADGEGVAVAIGQTILSSTDGTTWITGSGFTAPISLNAVAYGSGIWVAVGTSGEIRFSAGGTSWASGTAPAGFAGTYVDITFVENTFIAVTNQGRFHTSLNGAVWKQLERVNTDTFYLSLFGGSKIRKLFGGTTDGKILKSNGYTTFE